MLIENEARSSVDEWVFFKLRRSSMKLFWLIAFFSVLRADGALSGELEQLFNHTLHSRPPVHLNSTYGSWTMSPDDTTITEIGLERTACYGWCPVYTVIFRSDDSVRYVGERYVQKIGTFHGKLKMYAFHWLVRTALEMGIWEMRDAYSESVTDCSTSYIYIKKNGQKKVIRDYANSGPLLLELFQDRIDQTLGEVVWGDRDKEGHIADLLRETFFEKFAVEDMPLDSVLTKISRRTRECKESHGDSVHFAFGPSAYVSTLQPWYDRSITLSVKGVAGVTLLKILMDLTGFSYYLSDEGIVVCEGSGR